jgi:hypothetical protein
MQDFPDYSRSSKRISNNVLIHGEKTQLYHFWQQLFESDSTGAILNQPKDLYSPGYSFS